MAARGRGTGGRNSSHFCPSSSSLAAAAAGSLSSLFLLVSLPLSRASAAPSPSPSPEPAFDYGDALTKSLLYFESQRSGRLPYNQRVNWRGHSGLTDGLEQGVDLVGGYYDAGDHVKFGLPMAFTVTMLAWGVIEYGEEIAAADEYGHALEAIKWGTDYFIKVGEGDTDHYCWQRPEDMTTSRQAYKIDTAAAMAAASIVFRRRSPHYSLLLLHHARQFVAEAKKSYSSISGYNDELLWAALWLHMADAGGDGGWRYLDYFSWDIKYAGVQVLAAKVLMEGGRAQLTDEAEATLKKFRSKAEHYLCACLGKNNGSNVHRTRGYVSGATFLLTVYADYLRRVNQALPCPDGAAGPSELLSAGKSMVDYILGANPMGLSYLVGFGPHFPRRVHHRGSSIVSHKESKGFIGCMQGYDDWYARREDNPNVLLGALVGGPDGNDMFRDERGNYMQTEACTYNTAPLVGVFAKLHRLRRKEDAEQEDSSASISSY
ncbi:unnamed protein product [Spirodela intermedia]|uniref:Endoglucanase n=1 Tax=Spirodela intermedia TaxID=51605 RepID=A0A7I8ITP5_SPIIN|nr:unnamed protein product [Spirodela intermedia]CAA6661394.1 unnamed protein product [Spirodela intermedia]